MHEMAICESIVQALEEQAAVHAYSTVRAVRLEIGPMSCVEPEALRFSFDACARGTIADRARLDIIETKGTAWCFACSESVPVGRRSDPCPECGSHQIEVTGGDELRIKDMEVA